MLKSRRAVLRSALFASSILSTIVAADGAHAQAAADLSTQSSTTATGQSAPAIAPAVPQPADTAKTSEDIVVTGSRIRRDNYNTPSPIEIITHDDLTLAGNRSVIDALQSASVTSGTAQVNNTFLNYVTSGGPGSNTIGLRGLGADRTLVLLNGRRLSPAGSESQVGPADLNVLPTAIIDHVEVLKDGASTIYGSDAVAGVVNVITSNKIDGFTFDGFGSLPLHQGGGQSYRISGVYGKTFDRGHFAISAEYDQTSALKRRDRSWGRCPTDEQFDPQTGAFVGQENADGSPRCLPFQYEGGQGSAQDYILAIAPFGSPVGTHRYQPNPNQVADAQGDLDGFTLVDDLGKRPQANPAQYDEDIYSPVKNLTIYANGAYQLDALGNAEIYGEALFSRRLSSQTTTYQLSTPTGQYLTYLPGYLSEQLFPKALQNAGYYIANPLITIPDLKSSQRVNYLRANGGIRGDVGIKNWHYDANFMYSRNWARYSVDWPLLSRILESSTLADAPAGTPSDLVLTAGADRVAPGNYTCASNLNSDGSLIANPQCVPLDWYSASQVAGNYSPALRNWLIQRSTGHTAYEQMAAEINIDGDLFNLPAGAVGFSLGGTVRHDHINDVPSEASQNSDLYNLSSAGITRGSELVEEIYGELSVPIVKHKPFFEDLSAIVSARYTHYRLAGSDTTYKVSGNWSPTTFLRFRGSYGTSFRAPSLYQEYIGSQTGFYSASGYDPCYDYQSNYRPTDTRYKNCLSALSQTKVGSGNFLPNGGGPESISEGGKNLKPEKSNALNYGLVIQPKQLGFSFSADYFKIVVKDEVSSFGTNILDYCYDAVNFPNNIYCSLINGRDNSTGNITSFDDSYINIAKQSVDGIDFNFRYQHNIGEGQIIANVQATRVLHQKYQNRPEDEVDDYNGTLGNAGTAGGPRWTGALDLQYKLKGWTFRYGLQYVGPMNGDEVYDVDPSVDPYDVKTGKYFLHSLSVRHESKSGIEVTLGVTNLLDTKPEIISSGTSAPRLGNYFNYSGYDFIGRSLFMEVVKKF